MTLKWNHWKCALPSAFVKGSSRMRTVSVCGVAETSSPLPESNDELKPYGAPSAAAVPNDAADMATARGAIADGGREGGGRRVRAEESEPTRVRAVRTSEPRCMEGAGRRAPALVADGQADCSLKR